MEKYFLSKFFIAASGNRFLAGGNRFLLFRGFLPRFFPPYFSNITETSGRPFWRKEQIFWLMKTDLLASGNQIFPFSQTAINCCQWKQFFLQLKHRFWPILFFRLVKTSFLSIGNSIFFIPSFFLPMENVTEIWGKSNFRDEPYSCWWTPILFYFFRYFLQWKPYLSIVEAYFSIFFIRLLQTSFLPTKTISFWLELFCSY